MRTEEYIGVRFGERECVECFRDSSHTLVLRLLCQDCGNIAGVELRKIKKRGCPPCGKCSRVKHSHKRGGTQSAEYKSWSGMMQRCNNPKNPAYASYGGRGITVDERWKDFRNFIADMGSKPFGTSIERIDNNKGYCPKNCRWATRLEQNRNTRKSVKVDQGGVSRTISEWANILGMSPQTLYSRAQAGWDSTKILSKGDFRKP